MLEITVNTPVFSSLVRSQVGMGERFRSFFKSGNASMSDDGKEKRSDIIDLGGMSNPTQTLISVLGGSSKSGSPVNEQTALGVSAVYACVSLLSDMVAKLPIELFQKTPDGPKEIKDNSGQIALSTVPSGLHTSFELRQLMMTGKGLGGNGYARVFRDSFGDVISIEWLRPCDVTPRMWRKSNGQCEVVYKVEGFNELLTTYDVIHIRELSRDGITGISPITLLRESIGTAISQTEAAGSLMKNGTQFPGYLTTNNTLKPDQLEDARREFNAKYSGSAKAGSIPVLNGMFDFKATNGMSMSDAQFIESRRFELQEIARHYKIPSFLIGDTTASTTWGTGIEQQTLGFLNFSLDPHLKSFEEALNRTLLTTEQVREGYYFRFDRDELAGVSRNDTAQYFQTMRNIGVYSVNDIRAKLDEPKISKEDGGDDYGKPLNANAGSSQSSYSESESESELETIS